MSRVFLKSHEFIKKISILIIINRIKNNNKNNIIIISSIQYKSTSTYTVGKH